MKKTIYTTLLVFLWSDAYGKTSVINDYLGGWQEVPVDPNGKCDPSYNAGANVSLKGIETDGEAFCRILSAKSIKESTEKRVEISCMSGGEGYTEQKQIEIWRIEHVYGQLIFIQEIRGSLRLWARCPK